MAWPMVVLVVLQFVDGLVTTRLMGVCEFGELNGLVAGIAGEWWFC